MIVKTLNQLSRFLVLWLLVATAQAASVTWVLETTLQDQTLTEVFGQFDYDTTTGVFSNLQLSTTSPVAGLNQFVPSNDTVISGTNISSVGVFEVPGFSSIDISFDNNLSNPTQLELGLVEFSAFGENGNSGEFFSVRGTATLVPVPAAVWLFGSALAGLGWVRRRQAV